MDYAGKARQARLKVLEMIYSAQSSHVGSNFSCIDILTVLFEKVDIKKDKVLFSKGWAAASAYYFLSEKGFFPKKDLERFCREGEEQYIGLVEPTVPGVWAAGGAVGYGLSFGVGFALSEKLRGTNGNVYVLMSDGEMDVGMVWESALVAAKYQLNNLIAIIDYNKFQATGRIQEVLDIEPLASKWEAFGWQWMRGSGHDLAWLDKTFNHDIPLVQGYMKKPIVVVADTIKGKGVKEFEGKLKWHYQNVDEATYKQAVKELTYVS